MTGAGHEPVASEIARAIAGEASTDPRFPAGRWPERAKATVENLAATIAAHPWPCVVFDDQCRLQGANAAARTLLGTILEQETLLGLLVSRAFRERVGNYDEVVSAVAPSELLRAAGGDAPQSAAVRAVLAQLAAEDPDGFAQLQALWAAAPAPELSTRAVVPVLWRTEDGTLLTFHGVLSLWCTHLWYWALDWHPADAATWVWLGEKSSNF